MNKVGVQQGGAVGTEQGLVVLALNGGSSSLKFGLFRVDASRCEPLLCGEAASIRENSGVFRARDARGSEIISETIVHPSPRGVIVRIGRLLAALGAPAPAAIGHRIVHGGPQLREHCLIDTSVVARIGAADAYAPLHTPSALSVIHFAGEHFRGIPQVACFDTTFHADLPEVARVLPIPKALQSEGIQRYGFHGLSCASIVHQLEHDLLQRLPDRLVIAHLGNGASLTAVKGGKSIDTSMGLTPSGGLIMGTRSGDLDPGVLIYLMREKQFNAAMLEDLIDRRSGLIGISGLDSDMRRLREVAASNPDARLAVQMFCYSVRKQMAGMIAALDGVDVVVFTGGIGQHDSEARAEICSGLSWLGVDLDPDRNRTAANPISGAASRGAVYVLDSQEEQQIARHVWALVSERRSG